MDVEVETTPEYFRVGIRHESGELEVLAWINREMLGKQEAVIEIGHQGQYRTPTEARALALCMLKAADVAERANDG